MGFKYYIHYMKKNAAFVLVTMILVFLISLFMGLTVKSQGTSNLPMEEHYRLLEKEMVSDVRHYLNENGYRNSGITLTRKIDGNNQDREYTLTVHHDKIDRMEEEERVALGQTLTQFGFEFTTCSFETVYLFN